MPQPNKRSRTYRRVFRKTPGSRTVLHYLTRKPSAQACNMCGTKLQGVLRGVVAKIKNASKSRKKVDRPYGGELCSKCMRKVLVEKARK